MLRTSLWPAIHQPPVTIIVRDKDLKVSFEEALALHLREHDGFTTYDSFDMPNESAVVASVRAMERFDQPRESNMAVLYFWTLMLMPMMSEGGLIATPDPSPLTVDEITYSFERLTKNEAYNPSVKVQTANEDGSVAVSLHHGKVTTEPTEPVK